jgi:hypothetical protein
LKGRHARSCVSQGYFPGFSWARRNTAIAPDDENTPQVAISLLGDRSELLLAPGRILPRHQSDPGRKIASRPEDSWVRHVATIAVAPITPMPNLPVDGDRNRGGTRRHSAL